MSPPERVQAAFEKRATDQVPICHISFSSRVASALLGREAYVGFGIQQWREATALWQGEAAHQEFVERSFQDALDINRRCENDIARFTYPRYPVKPTQRIDDYTFLYEYGPEENWRILRYDPNQEGLYSCVFPYRKPPEPTFEDLERQVEAQERALENAPPPEASALVDDFTLRAQERWGHEWVIRVGGGGVSIPRDPIWLEAVALRPDLVARYLDVQAEHAVQAIEPLVRLGFRYFFGGGDFAGYGGPMYSPKAFRDLILPRLQRVAAAFQRQGAYLLFGSDGNLWPVAEDLFGRSGVHGFYEIDRRAGMDLAQLRERFPDLTLIGNISSHTLHRGTKEEVVEETRSCLEEAKRSHGVIVGVSNAVMPHTPIENVEAMLETIREYR